MSLVWNGTRAVGDELYTAAAFGPFAGAMHTRMLAAFGTDTLTLNAGSNSTTRLGTTHSSTGSDGDNRGMTAAPGTGAAFPGSPASSYTTLTFDNLNWTTLIAWVANLGRSFVDPTLDLDGWTTDDSFSYAADLLTDTAGHANASTRDALGVTLHNDRVLFPTLLYLGPNWPNLTRKRRRVIYSLSEAGTDGQVARFVASKVADPYGGAVTPSNEEVHSGHVFVRVSGAWVRDDSLQPDVVVVPTERDSNGLVILVRRGDLLTTTLANELNDVINGMTVTHAFYTWGVDTATDDTFLVDSSVSEADLESKFADPAHHYTRGGGDTTNFASSSVLVDPDVGPYYWSAVSAPAAGTSVSVPAAYPRQFEFYAHALTFATLPFNDNGTGLYAPKDPGTHVNSGEGTAIAKSRRWHTSASGVTDADYTTTSALGDSGVHPPFPTSDGSQGYYIIDSATTGTNATYLLVRWDFSTTGYVAP